MLTMCPFKLFAARFKQCQAGHYVVQWRIKVHPNLNIPNGIRFSVNVTYDAEPDTTGSFDFVLSSEKLAKLDKGSSCDLKLEELVVIQPHKREAKIELTLSNCEDAHQSEYSGLQVDFVKLMPFTGDNVGQSDPYKDLMERAARPQFTIDAMRSPAFEIDGYRTGTTPNRPITRLAWSKDGMFLAALALGDDTAYITVWDMKYIEDLSNPPTDTSFLHTHCAVAAVKFVNERTDHEVKLRDLSIGLAISPNGDQVAIYQEPIVGQWADDSNLGRCDFQFSLLNTKPKNSLGMELCLIENLVFHTVYLILSSAMGYS
ncbi:hypothetical protein BGZ65_001633 [Modicella reniformis]|uniref:Uncharacterized protein n=1 Tax=Modicella reniformis TaxID=1440133 RepID=A0A9P6M9T7_9FUNG|nr:hypothetical protein BGZ65_001633 [Modicella reniformis]